MHLQSGFIKEIWNHVSKQPSLWHKSDSHRGYIFCFKNSNKTFHTVLWGKRVTLEVVYCPNMFRDKVSQALTLFYFVLCICKDPRYNTATKNWWLWNLTALPFLCVLIIHWKTTDILKNTDIAVSLPVQLEFGEFKSCPIIGYHLMFSGSLLVKSLLKRLILFSFLGPSVHRSHLYRLYNCFATQIKHQDISYIYMPVL